MGFMLLFACVGAVYIIILILLFRDVIADWKDGVFPQSRRALISWIIIGGLLVFSFVLKSIVLLFSIITLILTDYCIEKALSDRKIHGYLQGGTRKIIIFSGMVVICCSTVYFLWMNYRQALLDGFDLTRTLDTFVRNIYDATSIKAARTFITIAAREAYHIIISMDTRLLWLLTLCVCWASLLVLHHILKAWKHWWLFGSLVISLRNTRIYNFVMSLALLYPLRYRLNLAWRRWRGPRTLSADELNRKWGNVHISFVYLGESFSMLSFKKKHPQPLHGKKCYFCSHEAIIDISGTEDIYIGMRLDLTLSICELCTYCGWTTR